MDDVNIYQYSKEIYTSNVGVVNQKPFLFNMSIRKNLYFADTNISGGQKQLIDLARTLLSKAEIILLDEVTSSLDPNTSKKISKILQNLGKNHTVIMITHAPKLMKIADHLIVIDKGKVVGQGRHKELLLKNKYYKSLQKQRCDTI